MSLTKDDLLAIKNILDPRFDALDGRMDGLESRMDALDGRMDGLENRMDGLEGSVEELKGSVKKLEGSVKKLEDDVTYIKVGILEGDVIPRLKTLESCYLDASNRYIKYSDLFKEKIEHISTLDQVVTDHSREICELQLRQASMVGSFC